MGQLISASINLSKIDKTKIVKGKDGSQYYDVTISVNDTKTITVKTSQFTINKVKNKRKQKKKELLRERESFWSSVAKPQQQAPHRQNDNFDDSENLPF